MNTSQRTVPRVKEVPLEQTINERTKCRNTSRSCSLSNSMYECEQNPSTAELITKDRWLNNSTYRRTNVSCGIRLACLRDSRKRKRSKGSVTSAAPSTSSSEQTFRSRCLFYISVALVLLSIACSTCFGIISLQIMLRCDGLETKIDSVRVSYQQLNMHSCLPCTELSQGPFEEHNNIMNNLIMKAENGINICCAKSAEQFSVLLNLFAKRKQMEIHAEEILVKENLTDAVCPNKTGSGKPSSRTEVISAHLVADDQNIAANASNGFQQIKNWSFGMPGTHLLNINMTGNSRLIVPETGDYFLYSQAGFLFYYGNTQNVEDAKQSLFHVVYRYNSIYPLDGSEELLRSELTQCWEKHKSFGRYASYVGASVRLSKGDQIYVKVSFVEYLTKSPQMTYFGLFKLG